MKQRVINQAYIALGKLSENEQLSEMSQWRIYQLRKELRQHVEFYNERRNMITKKYQEFMDDEGKISGEHALNYMSDCEELDELDIEFKPKNKPSIKLVKGIHCADIEELEEFVYFVPPDNE